MTSIQTYSGRFVDVRGAKPEHITLDDIAVPLSRIARFNGHTSAFYSVAQHSVLVSMLVWDLLDVELPEAEKFAGGKAERSYWRLVGARWGLLHDAHEAYIGDIASPLRELAQTLVACKGGLDAAIAERFGVPLRIVGGYVSQPVEAEALVRDAIKHADLVLLATEKRDLLRHDLKWSAELPEPYAKGGIRPLDCGYAMDAFVERFDELFSSEAEGVHTYLGMRPPFAGMEDLATLNRREDIQQEAPVEAAAT